MRLELKNNDGIDYWTFHNAKVWQFSWLKVKMQHLLGIMQTALYGITCQMKKDFNKESLLSDARNFQNLSVIRSVVYLFELMTLLFSSDILRNKTYKWWG